MFTLSTANVRLGLCKNVQSAVNLLIDGELNTVPEIVTKILAINLLHLNASFVKNLLANVLVMFTRTNLELSTFAVEIAGEVRLKNLALKYCSAALGVKMNIELEDLENLPLNFALTNANKRCFTRLKVLEKTIKTTERGLDITENVLLIITLMNATYVMKKRENFTFIILMKVMKTMKFPILEFSVALVMFVFIPAHLILDY